MSSLCQSKLYRLRYFILLFALLISACQEIESSEPSALNPESSGDSMQPTRPLALPTTQVAPASQPPPRPTARPTSTLLPDPTATHEPTPTLTPTPVGDCTERYPMSGLDALVTSEYGISRDYVPPGLVPLSRYLPITVTLGYPTQLREIAVGPLVEMISDMHSAGLKPTIISGYRSFHAQSIAWSKWLEQHPDRASIISAAPGHSEHQLGTTVDFGSPELPQLVGDDSVEFHTNFYLTSEGVWLAENAQKYGFTLSYPRETFELTGMYYEPWHYRFVGRETAEILHQGGVSLISHLLATKPPPCIP